MLSRIATIWRTQVLTAEMVLVTAVEPIQNQKNPKRKAVGCRFYFWRFSASLGTVVVAVLGRQIGIFRAPRLRVCASSALPSTVYPLFLGRIPTSDPGAPVPAWRPANASHL